MLFGGLESIQRNVNHKAADLRFFEFGNCYYYNKEKRDAEKLLAPYKEEHHLGIWLTGKRVSDSWACANEDSSIYELKAYVESIFTRLGIEMRSLTMNTVSNDIFETSISIETRGGKRLAIYGILRRSIRKLFDLDNEVFFAEINWKEMMKANRSYKVSYKDYSKFPTVRRDLALLIDKDTPFSEIEKIARETDSKLLREVTLFDVYEGKNLEAGKKSYAVSFTLQDENHTLTDKEIDKVMSKLVKNLEYRLGAKLR
jgi:phenylalanyl-tRNA synthetase beta chain